MWNTHLFRLMTAHLYRNAQWQQQQQTTCESVCAICSLENGFPHIIKYNTSSEIAAHTSHSWAQHGIQHVLTAHKWKEKGKKKTPIRTGNIVNHWHSCLVRFIYLQSFDFPFPVKLFLPSRSLLPFFLFRFISARFVFSPCFSSPYTSIHVLVKMKIGTR